MCVKKSSYGISDITHLIQRCKVKNTVYFEVLIFYFILLLHYISEADVVLFAPSFGHIAYCILTELFFYTKQIVT